MESTNRLTSFSFLIKSLILLLCLIKRGIMNISLNRASLANAHGQLKDLLQQLMDEFYNRNSVGASSYGG